MTGCCDEPGCKRTYPVSLYLADFSDRVYAVTRRRVVSERGDGTATFAAAERHDVTAQMREFLSRNPEWTASPEAMLREFHASKAIHGGLMPDTPTADIPGWVQDLRLALLDEEVRELHDAVAAGDITGIADAIADIAYVVAGTAVAYGIPFDAVFREVHRSNMTKVNTPDEAKLVKGPGYEPPRIAEILGVEEKPVPAPVFSHHAYGVDLDWIGEDGGMVAKGHVPLYRFAAACNHLARTEAGFQNIWDEHGAKLEDVLAIAAHGWAVPVAPGPGCEWAINYGRGITDQTPGSFPVTVMVP